MSNLIIHHKNLLNKDILIVVADLEMILIHHIKIFTEESIKEMLITSEEVAVMPVLPPLAIFFTQQRNKTVIRDTAHILVENIFFTQRRRWEILQLLLDLHLPWVVHQGPQLAIFLNIFTEVYYFITINRAHEGPMNNIV